MANSILHAGLPYPIRYFRYTVLIPYLNAAGDPTDPGTPDTEISIDGGAFADTTNEVTTITGSNGMGYLTLTETEMDAAVIGLAAKVSTGPKNTLITLYPRALANLVIGTHTATAGDADTITLLSVSDGFNYTGCFVGINTGTGSGQVRKIKIYDTTTLIAYITPSWETAPDNTSEYYIMLPEGMVREALYRTGGGHVR